MADDQDADDPARWSVDHVIHELCRNHDPNWMDSGFSVPIPRANEIEKAFRENDIDGDVLLQLGPSDFHAMDIKSIGQINKLKRIVMFLRTRSRNYSVQLERFPSMTVMPTVEPTPPIRTALQQMPIYQPGRLNSDDPASSSLKATFSPGAISHISRSVAPGHSENTLLEPQIIGDSKAELAHGGREEDTMLDLLDRSIDQQKSQHESGTPEVRRLHTSRDTKRPGDSIDAASHKRQRIHASPANANSESLQASRVLFDVPFTNANSVKDTEPNHKQSDIELSDEVPGVDLESSELHDRSPHSLDRLLELYPVQDDDDDNVLPLYGESDEEDREMTAESSTSEFEDERLQDSESSSLTEDHINQILEGCIAEFVEDWKARKQDLVQKRAHQKWQIAASRPDLKATMLRTAQKDFEHVQGRLSHLRQVLSKMQFSKADDVKKQCESLQVSVAQREEYSLYVRILESEEEPVRPNLIQMKRPQTHRQPLDNGDILCESEDEDGLRDFISDDERRDEMVIAHQHDAMALDPGLNDNQAVPMTANSVDDHAMTAGDDIISSTEDVIIEDTRDPVPPPATPRRYTVSDWYCGDADDEDGEGPLPLFKQDSSNKKRAAEGKIRNPLVLPISDDSSDTRRSLHHRRSPLSPKAKARRAGKSTEHAIVLTSSPARSEEAGGDESFDIHTPELNPTETVAKVPKMEPLSAASVKTKQSQPELVIPDLAKVAAIPWRHLINDPQNNGMLALAKAISEVHEQDASILLQYVLNLNFPNMEDDLKEGLIALRSETDTDIVGVPKHKQDTVLLLTLLYISYVLVRSFSEDEYLDDREGDRAWNMIALTVSTFHEALTNILRQRINLARQAISLPVPVSIEGSSLETDSGETGAESTDAARSKGKGRRKKARSKPSHLRETLSANNPLDTQRLAKQRVADQEARKAVINHRLAQTSSQSGDIQIPVNFKEPLVMLDQHIARRIKPHQVTGVQFMWRELIEDTQQQGCLLAHTMGLGKTMQVISTLVTIAQCVRSLDPEIKAHIPPVLHDLRVLILSPPALSENWYDELMFWMPKHDTLGPICKITNRSKQPYYDIKQWSESGGVLLLGYDRLVSYTKTPSRTPHESEEQYAQKAKHHQDMAQWLFDLPKVVIADEAHMLKNPTAKRAETAMKIKTMSRVALTGSPLSNHLEEYWAMINFIAPGYLGELSKFRQKFVEPINRCLGVESGAYDRRLGLRKMHVLKKIVDPKVNRADITAIKNDLPSKTEFFITVPLTDLQLEMYKVCVNYFRGVSAEGGLGKGKVASLLQWIAVLSLLCNHPWTFEQKLNDPERKGKHRKPHAEDTEDLAEEDVGPAELGAEDVDTTGQPTMLEAMKLALAIRSNSGLSDLTNIQDSTLSHRMVLVKAIIKESLRLHEKVLVFSHSLLTLDYMELVLAELGCPYERIDGGLATDKRQRASKEFNAGTSKTKVFLISTRAGGLGLNLFGATRVIILDYSFNPSWEEQAIGRAYRIGQRKPVFVYRFKSGGTFEDVTFNQTIFKTQLFTRIIDHKAVLRKGSKVEAGRYLIDPSSPKMEDFSGCKGKDPEIMDKVMQDFDCIRNIVLTETFAQDIDEGLTAIEIEEANQEIEDERLAREDPEAYQRRLAARSAQQYRTAQAHAPSVLTPQRFTTAIQQLTSNLFSSSSSNSTPNFIGRPHQRPTGPPSAPSGRSSYADETGPVQYQGTQQNKQ